MSNKFLQVIFICTIFILIILGKFILLGILSLVSVSVLLLFPLLREQFQYLKFRRQRKTELRENTAIGAVDETQIFRELREEEKFVLSQKWYIFRKFIDVVPYTIVLNIAVIFYFLNTEKNTLWGNLFSGLSFLGIIILSIQFFLIYLEGRLYKDLRSPVFLVRGKLVKITQRTKDKPIKIFTVRGLEFDDDENNIIEELWKKFSDGDRLEIEYSPASRHIWKIEKV